MRNRTRSGLLGPALIVLLAGALAGCAATHHESPGKPIDQRPTPPQPAQTEQSVPRDSIPVPPPRTMTSSGEDNVRALAVRDTVAVSKALKRCAGKNLLPEQETTYDATQKLLDDTRAALLRGDVTRARSLARNARQLVSSLDCP